MKGRMQNTDLDPSFRRRDTYCIEEKASFALTVEFVMQDGRWIGLPIATLVNFVLERNPEFQDRTDSPPDRLTLAFATHDVVLLGWKLNEVKSKVDQSKPIIVRLRDARYAGMEDENEAVVTEIAVTSVRQK